MLELRRASGLVVLAAAMFLLPLLTSHASAATTRSCGTLTIVPRSGDAWFNVKVKGVTCSYAKRFLKRTELPPRWRGQVVRKADPVACGGPRIRYWRGSSRQIVGSHSAC